MWNIVYILFELGKIILWAVLLFSRRQNVHIQLLFFLTHFLKPPKIKLFRKVLIKKVKDCFSLLWEQFFWEKLNEKVSRKLLSVEIAKLLNSIFYSNYLLFVPKILFSLETYCNRKFQTTFCYAVQFQWLCEWKMEMWKFKRGKCNFDALNVV